MTIVDVTSADDPRLDPYRSLKEHRLREESGRFIAESEPVVRKLLASRLRTESILATPARAESLAAAVTGDTVVYRAAPGLLDGVAGFHVHRGCLAVGLRPAQPAIPAEASLLVALEDLVDVDNVGAMARNAAALGADALILSPGCADPFYRKAIRVSMGAVFDLPIVRLASWPNDLVRLCRARGAQLVGAVLDPDAHPLERWVSRLPLAVLVGQEGPGLSSAARAACDTRVTIPMAPPTDSLNVATAAAIVLWAVRARR